MVSVVAGGRNDGVVLCRMVYILGVMSTWCL